MNKLKTQFAGIWTSTKWRLDGERHCFGVRTLDSGQEILHASIDSLSTSNAADRKAARAVAVAILAFCDMGEGGGEQ